MRRNQRRAPRPASGSSFADPFAEAAPVAAKAAKPAVLAREEHEEDETAGGEATAPAVPRRSAKDVVAAVPAPSAERVAAALQADPAAAPFHLSAARPREPDAEVGCSIAPRLLNGSWQDAMEADDLPGSTQRKRRVVVH